MPFSLIKPQKKEKIKSGGAYIENLKIEAGDIRSGKENADHEFDPYINQRRKRHLKLALLAGWQLHFLQIDKKKRLHPCLKLPEHLAILRF